MPLHLTKTKLSEGGAASWNFQMITRLKPSITPAQAVTDAERVAHEIMRNYPAFMASLQITAVVRPLAGGHRSSGSPAGPHSLPRGNRTADCMRQPRGPAAGARHPATANLPFDSPWEPVQVRC